MKKGKFLLGILCFLFLCALLFPFPSREAKPRSENVSVTGVLRFVGNAPFGYLVLTDADDNDYLLEGEKKEELRKLIGRPVRVRGLLHRREVTAANGKRLRDELTLVIVSIEIL
jgi:hypothetical protein